jgi:hypothetical protein
MTEDGIDELSVLHQMKVKGFASAERIAAALGAEVSQVEPLCREAEKGALARYREGRVTGFTLTPAGRARHDVLRAAALSPDVSRALEEAHRAFLAPNRLFKQLTTEWQMRPDGADPTPLLDRLDEVHVTMSRIVTAAAAVIPRFAFYLPRFERARAALRAGDASAFARPLSDSYHDVWMELHEDLISSLALTRTEADE